LPSHLSRAGQKALLDKMEAGPHGSRERNESGYVCAYEVPSTYNRPERQSAHVVTRYYADTRTKNRIYLKIGCTNNPTRRIGEWRRKCQFRELEFCGVWPSSDNPRDGAGFGRPWSEPIKQTKSQYMLESKHALSFASSISRDTNNFLRVGASGAKGPCKIQWSYRRRENSRACHGLF
jgi:hypothetical protein